MSRTRYSGIAALLAVMVGLVLAGCVGADETNNESVEVPDEPSAITINGDNLGEGASVFPAVTNFAAAGPFRTKTTAEGPQCTTFRPDPLGAEGRKHPVIVWGNGTGASVASYRAVLTHWASHGFIVTAANTSSAGSGKDQIACLDFVLAQNEAAGSVYFGKVDAEHIGVSGHSQGGGGALMAAVDPRVTVSAPLEPYTSFGLGGFKTASIAQQHAPMFLMSGANDNIATRSPNQSRVFSGTKASVFWGTLAGADHIFSGTGNISGFRAPATAWFRAHLMGDKVAAALFFGESFGLAEDKAWTILRKGIE